VVINANACTAVFRERVQFVINVYQCQAAINPGTLMLCLEAGALRLICNMVEWSWRD